MVEGGREPAIGSMATTAIRAETASVLIIPGMAGGAVLRGGFEVHNRACIDVALSTRHLGMFPD